MATLFGTPIIRSLFIVGRVHVRRVRPVERAAAAVLHQVLGATEFEYGLQEGLTSVGFVVGSLFMARFSRLLPEPAWIVVSLAAMGVARGRVCQLRRRSRSPS